MKALVGYTGFVGSNIDRHADFDVKYNSKNITDAYGIRPDFLVYAGVRAEKYLANHQPEKDLANIQGAFDNIKKIDPRQLVLISTSDVYKVPVKVDENTPIDTEGLHAYGKNRYILEELVREAYPEAVIIRLPGLYGPGIKKNFIYDFIKRIPFMLKKEKFEELVSKDDFITPFYIDQGNGFYQCSYETEDQRLQLKDYFERIGFSALQFTDSRSQFQFYPLSRLWDDIQRILESGEKLVNIVTEPVTAGEVYQYVCGKPFVNEMNRPPAIYDIYTVHAEIFGSKNPYIMDKKTVLKDLKEFILSAE